MNKLFSFFSWRGTLNRRDYFRRVALATALFMAGVCLQLNYEEALGYTLSLEQASSWHPLFFIPLLLELLSAFGNPLALPAFFFTGSVVSAPEAAQAAAMATSSPALCISLFLLATLLMLGSGLYSLALCMRRLRDTGASPFRLVAFFAVFVPLSFLLSFEELPFSQLLALPYFIWFFVWLFVQWRMLLRPARL